MEEESDEPVFEDLDKEELRRLLLDADQELERSLGENSTVRIRAANQRRPAIIVRPDRYLKRHKGHHEKDSQTKKQELRSSSRDVEETSGPEALPPPPSTDEPVQREATR
jgi:hypothetical protein